MNVQLTEDQKALIRKGVETGRYRGEDDAVREAMELWEERERYRAEILASIEMADASIARGEGRILDETSTATFVKEISARGRARLAAELAKQ